MWDGCSTPFGITADGTPMARVVAPAVVDVCSTPFGITADGTVLVAVVAQVTALAVLNAFRHHG